MPLARALVGWVRGFYAGRKNDTRVEVLAFVDEAERVITLCRENESMRLMTLVSEDMRRKQGPGRGSPPTASH
jgi:HdeA/HdeB family